MQSFFFLEISKTSSTNSVDSSWCDKLLPISTGLLVDDSSDEKLQYAFRMILEVYRGKSMTNENEIRALKQTVEELKIANSNLTKKFQSAEREIMEQQHRNSVLVKDNESLAMANRQLIQRCDKYKRIQQTFSEALENSGHEDDHNMQTTFASEYRPNFGTTPTPVSSLPVMSVGTVSQAAPPIHHHMSPPKMQQATVGATNATSAANGFDSSGKDGKQFFRVVRTRLPFESFNAFLTVIKKLNNHEFSRDVAVEEAKKIFGPENQDLLGDFQAIITRHIPAA